MHGNRGAEIIIAAAAIVGTSVETRDKATDWLLQEMTRPRM